MPVNFFTMWRYTDGRSAGLLTMQRKDRGFRLEDVTRALQATTMRAGPAAGAGYTLVGAIIVLGGAGYLLDGWLGTAPWLLVGGLFAGIVVGFYELVKMTRAR
jgi:ATP synthase protein I